MPIASHFLNTRTNSKMDDSWSVSHTGRFWNFIAPSLLLKNERYGFKYLSTRFYYMLERLGFLICFNRRGQMKLESSENIFSQSWTSGHALSRAVCIINVLKTLNSLQSTLPKKWNTWRVKIMYSTTIPLAKVASHVHFWKYKRLGIECRTKNVQNWSMSIALVNTSPLPFQDLFIKDKSTYCFNHVDMNRFCFSVNWTGSLQITVQLSF